MKITVFFGILTICSAQVFYSYDTRFPLVRRAGRPPAQSSNPARSRSPEKKPVSASATMHGPGHIEVGFSGRDPKIIGVKQGETVIKDWLDPSILAVKAKSKKGGEHAIQIQGETGYLKSEIGRKDSHAYAQSYSPVGGKKKTEIHSLTQGNEKSKIHTAAELEGYPRPIEVTGSSGTTPMAALTNLEGKGESFAFVNNQGLGVVEKPGKMPSNHPSAPPETKRW